MKKYDLKSDSSAIVGKENSGEMVEGKWKAESKILPPHGLPEQIRLRIKWEAPNLEYQTMEMRSDKARHNP